MCVLICVGYLSLWCGIGEMTIGGLENVGGVDRMGGRSIRGLCH